MRELEVKHFELMMDTNQDEFDYQVVLVPLLNSIVLWKRAARQRGHVSERETGITRGGPSGAEAAIQARPILLPMQKWLSWEAAS